jgi:hypothetical protein
VKEHKRWIISAASHAGKAADFIMNRAARNGSLVTASVTT